ncbi:hypothetical protein KXR86_11840 [Microbacterium barkeri]
MQFMRGGGIAIDLPQLLQQHYSDLVSKARCGAGLVRDGDGKLLFLPEGGE